MGISIRDIDISDGVTKLKFFNTRVAPNQPLVPRFVIDVSADLVKKSTVVAHAWVITRVTDNKVVMAKADFFKTQPSDLGGYIIWYDGILAAQFSSRLLYKFQVFVLSLVPNIILASEEWYFYVGDW